MEIMEPTPSLAKKLRNIVRMCIYMLKKGTAKNNLMLDLNLLLKKGKLAGKALGHIMSRHHSSVGCSSIDVQPSYIPSKDYEFSFNKTPLLPIFHSRKKNHHYNHRSHDVKFVKNIYDMLKKYETAVEASPLVVLPGFGMSPKVRQLRVTDSPFPLKGEESEDIEVDKMADEFISKFYKELKNQKRVAALQSPSPYHMWVI